MLSAIDHLLPAVRGHRFNTELFAGTLPQEVFDFYLLHDAPYLLKGVFPALTHLSRRLANEEQTQLLVTLAQEITDYAKYICEQELMRHNTARKKLYSPALFSHEKFQPIPVVANQIEFLLHHAEHEHPAVAIASLLPCNILYVDLGRTFQADDAHPNHLFKEWISFYTCPKFLKSTESLTNLMTLLYEQEPCPLLLARMTKVFVASTEFESNFWDAAYAVCENKAEPRGSSSRCIIAPS